MILRARVVLPIAQPPIEDGAVWIAGDHIRWLGRWHDLAAPANETIVDCGENVLLPGLVNAHCHLDYTDFAGQIPPPKNFPDWIKAIVSLKANWSYTDFAQSWLRGARMLLHSGVTTVADVEAVPELLPQVWEGTPLRVFSFWELISLKTRQAATKLVNDAVARFDSLPSDGRCGLSPHAPYTTSPELLRHAATVARQKRMRLTTHVAESAEEFDMFMHRRGALFDWLQPQRDMCDCGRVSPIRHLARSGLLADNLLAVHANYLAPGDAELLASHSVSVAHCPRSHAYFRHQPFSWDEVKKARVNVCLGTDSLATVSKRGGLPLELDLFREMQTFVEAFPGVAPEVILQMTTLNGARGLGLAGRIGQISEGALADLIVVPASGKKDSAFESVVHHQGPVAASMIAGVWAIPPQAS